MDESRFWHIIGEAYRPDLVEQAEALQHVLGSLTWIEVLDFQAKLEEKIAAADTPDLRGAALLVNGDASAQGVRNFLLGLVASGSRAYEAALQNADALADFLEGDPVDGYGLDRVAVRVFEEKTGGSDFYVRLAQRHPNLPKPLHSLHGNEDEARQRLPRLSEMYPAERDEEPSE